MRRLLPVAVPVMREHRPLEDPPPAPAPQTPEALLLLGVVLQAARDVGRSDALGASARAFLEDRGVQALIAAAWGVAIGSGVDPRQARRLVHRHNVEKGHRAILAHPLICPTTRLWASRGTRRWLIVPG